MQADARAVSEAVRLVVAVGGLDELGEGLLEVLALLARELDVPKARHRVDEHLGLEHALAREVDMAKLGAPGPLGRVPLERGLVPDVLAAILRRVEHPCDRGAGERLLLLVGDAREHTLPGDRVGDEHHAPVVASDAHAAVGNSGDFELDLGADFEGRAFALF